MAISRFSSCPVCHRRTLPHRFPSELERARNCFQLSQTVRVELVVGHFKVLSQK